MATPSGATNYITITSAPAQVAATMPDAGSTFAVDLVIDEAAEVNWEGGAATFIDGLAADYSDLRVTDSTGEIEVAFGVKGFSQTTGSRRLVLGIGIPSTAPLSSTVGVEYRLWRGCTGGQAEDREGVAPAADGYAGYWPMCDASGGVLDWSDNDNDLAASGGVTYGATGPVAGAVDLDGTGMLSRTGMTGGPTANWTLLAWVSLDDWGSRTVFSSDSNNPMCRVRDAAVTANAPGYWESGLTILPNSTWHLLAWTHTGTDEIMRVDAASVAHGSSLGSGAAYGTVAFGEWPPAAGQKWDGRLAEGQLSIARSADWVTTVHNCQSANGTFWTVGEEQSVATSGGLALPLAGRMPGRCGPSLAGRL